MSIKEEIHALTDEMLTNLGRLVAIDSQLGTPAEGMPFGEGPAKALEVGLKIADELGFKTVNLDNYCGYAEMGEGDEIVGIAGSVFFRKSHHGFKQMLRLRCLKNECLHIIFQGSFILPPK